MGHIEYVGTDGKPWPSATQLTSLLPQVWLWSWYKASVKKHGWRGWQRCKAQSNRGMKIGSEVHSLIEKFIAVSMGAEFEKFKEVSGKYESQAYADALFDKVNPLVEKYIAVEPHVVSNRLRIHGTADMIVKLKDYPENWVGDWKTSASKSETYPIQLAIYAKCWNEMHPENQVDDGFIARVDKKSKKLGVKIDEYKNLTQYYPVVEALRCIWEYSNG